VAALAHRSAPQTERSPVSSPPAAEASVQGLYGNGFAQEAMGLPQELQTRFERSLGVSLSDVRLHVGQDAAAEVGAAGADAFAFGEDILFGEGEADFQSREGQTLLAHEVAHTVQQQGQAPFAQHDDKATAPAGPAEVQADEAAKKMVAGQPAAATAPAPLTQPTPMNGPLGPTVVYPDSHKGELPKGAFRQSDYEKRAGIMERVGSGASQLTIDTSNFTEGIDPEKDPKAYQEALKKGEAFRKQHMDYLRDAVKTPTGLTMLEELDASKHKTTIVRTTGRNNCETKPPGAGELVPVLDADGKQIGTKPGPGGDTVVHINPDDKSYFDPARERKEEPWQTERPRYGFYHELVHAYHETRGDAAPGSMYPGGPSRSEPQAVGKAKADAKTYAAGGYPDEAVSDNAIRRDMGKKERPEY
jgi:hypothetical protein